MNLPTLSMFQIIVLLHIITESGMEQKKFSRFPIQRLIFMLELLNQLSRSKQNFLLCMHLD